MDFYDKSHIFRLKNRKKNRVRKELEMSEEAQVTAAGNEISASFVAAQKRSDATLEKLKANPSSFTMLTGD